MGGGRQGNDRVSGVQQDGVQVSPITPVIFDGARSAITAGVNQFPATPRPALARSRRYVTPPPLTANIILKRTSSLELYIVTPDRVTTEEPVYHLSTIDLVLGCSCPRIIVSKVLKFGG